MNAQWHGQLGLHVTASALENFSYSLSLPLLLEFASVSGGRKWQKLVQISYYDCLKSPRRTYAPENFGGFFSTNACTALL